MMVMFTWVSKMKSAYVGSIPLLKASGFLKKKIILNSVNNLVLKLVNGMGGEIKLPFVYNWKCLGLCTVTWKKNAVYCLHCAVVLFGVSACFGCLCFQYRKHERELGGGEPQDSVSSI